MREKRLEVRDFQLRQINKSPQHISDLRSELEGNSSAKAMGTRDAMSVEELRLNKQLLEKISAYKKQLLQIKKPVF